MKVLLEVGIYYFILQTHIIVMAQHHLLVLLLILLQQGLLGEKACTFCMYTCTSLANFAN